MCPCNEIIKHLYICLHRELDIIPLLVRLLDHPDEDCQRNAAGALKNLSYGRFLDDNKVR